MRMRGGVTVGALAVALAIPMAAGARSADPPSAGPRVTARAAFLMDAHSGEVLWERDADRELPPASTTKVMTAILALESNRLDDVVAASGQACSVVPSKINLRPGQQLSLEDLVYAILLNSANDASVAIAEHLGGSEHAFAVRMTERARQLGASRTRFANPHGLTADGHYSTVRDLATIFRHALEVPGFRRIISTRSLVVDAKNSARRIALRSHNRLLDTSPIPVIGKTGYTVPAKKCFVGAGSYGQREVIVAVLGSQDLWGDTRRLLDFAFGDQLPTRGMPRWADSGARDSRLASVAAAERNSAKRRQVAAVRERQFGQVKSAHKVAKSAQSGRGPIYAIHVGTFDRADRARRLERALDRRGYAAAVDQTLRGKGKSKRTQYAVHVGSYRDREEAESVARSMASEADLAPRVVRR